MLEESIYERVLNNEYIRESDKDAIRTLFKTSDCISFGKIGPRSEGYIYKAVGYPRATNVLQMDGMRAAALLEWAKSQVAGRIEFELVKKLHDEGNISLSDIGVICKEGLEDPDRQKEEAADIGTGHHDNIENWLNGLPFEDNEILRKFQQIWAKERVELICTELPLIYVDPETGHGFGGKLDILAYKDGEFIIYDNKTSKSVHNSYGLQVGGAYKHAVEQMSKGAIKISKCKIIHLPDEKTLKDWQVKQYKKLGNLVELKNYEEAFVHYKILLEQYYRRNNKYF